MIPITKIINPTRKQTSKRFPEISGGSTVTDKSAAESESFLDICGITKNIPNVINTGRQKAIIFNKCAENKLVLSFSTPLILHLYRPLHLRLKSSRRIVYKISYHPYSRLHTLSNTFSHTLFTNFVHYQTSHFLQPNLTLLCQHIYSPDITSFLKSYSIFDIYFGI